MRKLAGSLAAGPERVAGATAFGIPLVRNSRTRTGFESGIHDIPRRIRGIGPRNRHAQLAYLPSFARIAFRS